MSRSPAIVANTPIIAIAANVETNSHKGTMFGIPIRDLLTYTNIAYLLSLLLTFALTASLWRVSVAAQNESDTELARYKSHAAVEIANANAKADVARKEAAEANLKTEQLRALFAGRTISKDDANAFILSQEEYTTVGAVQRTEIKISATMGDPESIGFAVELYFLFGKAGMLRTKVLPTALAFSYGLKLTGPNTPEFDALKDSFRKAHIQFQEALGTSILVEVGLNFPSDFPVELLK